MNLACDPRVGLSLPSTGKRDLLGLQKLDELGFNERNDRPDTALQEKAPCTLRADQHEEAHHFR